LRIATTNTGAGAKRPERFSIELTSLVRGARLAHAAPLRRRRTARRNHGHQENASVAIIARGKKAGTTQDGGKKDDGGEETRVQETRVEEARGKEARIASIAHTQTGQGGAEGASGQEREAKRPCRKEGRGIQCAHRSARVAKSQTDACGTEGNGATRTWPAAG
jgi:hypothetical protein